MYFCVSLDQFIPVLLAFVVLGLVFSAPSQEIGWAECLRNDLFRVEWYVKPQLNQLILVVSLLTQIHQHRPAYCSSSQTV